jgi:hypothetical protein
MKTEIVDIIKSNTAYFQFSKGTLFINKDLPSTVWIKIEDGSVALSDGSFLNHRYWEESNALLYKVIPVQEVIQFRLV